MVLQLDHTGAPNQRYLWADAVDHLLAAETVDDGGAEDVVWALGDHQNTIRDLATYDPISGDTTVANHITYDSFGNVTAETSAAVDHLFGYTGRPFDEATGLQNNLNRWYDPEVGRWLTEDPIGFEGGDANLYRYAHNNPANYVDFTGLWVWPWDPTASWNPVDTTRLWLPVIWENGGKDAIFPPGSPVALMIDATEGAIVEGQRGKQVFDNARASDYGVLSAMYQSGAIVVGDMTGVTNFSYWLDNTDPVTGIRASTFKQYLNATLGTIQLSVEALVGAEGLHGLRAPSSLTWEQQEVVNGMRSAQAYEDQGMQFWRWAEGAEATGNYSNAAGFRELAEHMMELSAEEWHYTESLMRFLDGGGL